jgi:hypothetical protein
MHDVPKDLGRRIVEASRLAVATHLLHSLGLVAPRLTPLIGGADPDGETGGRGGAVADGFTVRPFNAESEAE